MQEHRIFGRPLAILLVALLAPTLSYAAAFKNYWSANGIAALSGSAVNLRDKDKNVVATLPIASVRQLISVQEKITREAGISADLIVTDGDSPNAFATSFNGKNVIGFNIPMLRLCGDDPHTMAAVMGHEVAHHIKGHGAAQQNHDAVAGLVGLLAGLAMDRKLSQKYGSSNLGQNVASLGVTLASRAFSRDQEREADDVGVRLMRSANFDPSGAVRLWRNMPGGSSSFFSTHPTSSERIGNIQTVIASLAPWQPQSETIATTAKPVEVTSKSSTNAEYKEDSSAPDDPFILGLQAFRAGRMDEARQLATKAADAGDPRGQVGLGFFYYTGQGGVVRDYDKAREYLELAEQQGSSMATTVLGIMNEEGKGFAKDPAKAADYYRRASSAGFADAMARLSSLKARGLGVEKDIPGAFDLASKAAAGGSNLGSYAVGLAYLNGIAVSKDPTKAREFFESGASRGHAPSDNMLGNMYVSGAGVTLDYQLAASYYKRAADKNDPAGKANLGFMYFSGRGVGKDVVLARSLFQAAYTQGAPLGALGLGHLYRQGVSVSQDDIQALTFYEFAARKGLASAVKPRDELVSKMNPQDVASARSRAELMLSSQ